MKRAGNILFYLLIVACLLTLVAELFVHKHGEFDWEHIPLFHAGYGFLVFLFIVFAGVMLRKIVKRPENYYDR